MSKALKLHHPKADTKGGLYFQFRPGDNEAWLGVGPDSPQTKFDVLPAYTRPGDQKNLEFALYTFCKSSNTSDNAKWVIWRRNEAKAELSDAITNKGMASLRGLEDGRFKIVLEREATKEEKKKKRPQSTVLEELTVDDSMISEADTPCAAQDFLEFKPFRKGKELEVRPQFYMPITSGAANCE